MGAQQLASRFPNCCPEHLCLLEACLASGKRIVAVVSPRLPSPPHPLPCLLPEMRFFKGPASAAFQPWATHTVHLYAALLATLLLSPLALAAMLLSADVRTEFPIFEDRIATQHLVFLRMSRIQDPAQLAKASRCPN